jgi:RNA polymerase sigma-70 factor (ECF subfamily)
MVSPTDGELQEIPIADEGPGPDEVLFRNEYAAEVRRALRGLPDIYRRAIELCDLEGLSYLEIADLEKTTIGTVRSRIHRGRKILREIVRKQAPHLMAG